MIAVTIGCGERYGAMARFAARSAGAATGLPVHILGERERDAFKVPTAHYLKLHLFEIFPEASSILYFDADLFFLRRWDPTLLAGRPEVVCVRDRWSQHCIEEDAARAEVPVREYFNTGLMILNREMHAAWLTRTRQELGTIGFTKLYDQTYLNWTRWKLRLPALFLHKRWNRLGWEDAPPGEEAIGAHSDRMKKLPLSEMEDYAASALRIRDLPKADPIADSEMSSPARTFEPGEEAGHRPTQSLADERYYRDLLAREVQRPRPYPEGRFSGRGIVICGGGMRYLPSLWVNVRMLREHGCKLPVEVWHLGPAEIDEEFAALIAPFGVRLVDALEVRKQHPARHLGGWELKAFSLLHCAFEEVLLLDADNMAVADPAFLFDTPEHGRTGAIFWPDYLELGEDRPIWRITGVAYRSEPEFESGQILVHKARCWKALQLSMVFNEHSDYFYRHIHGDKETFHFAWRLLGQEYAMTPHRIFSLPATMCHHDFDARRIFQHRNFDKWKIDGSNRRIDGFLHEDRCFALLSELRERWSWMPPGVRRWHARGKNARERAAAEALMRTRHRYHRVGHDRRPMTFEPDGRIGEGAAGCEEWWDVAERDGDLSLTISGESSRTMTLRPVDGGCWSGKWEVFEQMPIELTPLPSDGADTLVATLKKR